MADQKKISALPLASEVGDNDVFVGNQDGVTKRTAASSFRQYANPRLADYAALRAYTGTADIVSIIKKGVNGLFYLDAADTTSADNGGTIIVGGTKRWKRYYAGEINVQWFGAAVNGTTDDTAAVNSALAFCSANGGGTVLVPTGICIIGIGGIKIKSNVLLKGCGSDNTILQVTGSPTTVCVEFSLFPADFNYGGVENITIRNSGLCLAGITTPTDEIAFNRAQRWYFDRLHFRGSDILSFLEVGDCVQGTVTNTQIRASYKATLVDSGQNQTVGIRLTGARGNVGCRLDGNMIVGVRTGVHVTGSAEGYFFQNSEVVGSWVGLLIDSNPSKPGGYVDNIHFNCSYRCIDMIRRRAANVGTVQFYREITYYQHGLGWSGISIDNSAQITIDSIIVRIGAGFTDLADIVAVRVVSSSKISVGRILSTDANGVGLALRCTDSTTIYIGSVIGETLPGWAEILGTSNYISICDVQDSGTQSIKPIVFGGSTSRQNIKAPRTTGVRDYTEVAYTAAANVSLSPRVDSQTRRLTTNVGAGAYIVDINLQSTYAVNGDVFNFKVNVTANSSSTLNFIDAANSTNRKSIVSTTTGQIRILKFIFNGAGWILADDLISL